MKANTGNAIHYPQVTTIKPKQLENDKVLPGQGGIKGDGEFQKVLDSQIGSPAGTNPLKFSAHASQRLHDRKISFDAKTMGSIRDAVEKADAKGLGDALILTKDAALIVNVKNKTVITAMDREALKGNVFSNIDGAVII